MNPAVRSEKGFSLIELAFVLFIAGFLAALGYGAVKNAMSYSRSKATESALSGILLKAAAETASSGAVPDVSFFGEIKDGFGRNIRIITADSADLCSGSGGISIITCLNADCSEKHSGKSAAVVALSAGEDGLFDTPADNQSVTILHPSASNDDSAVWTGFSEAMQNAGCGTPLKIVTRGLPALYSGSLYTAEVESVPPADKWCAEADGETAALLGINSECADNSDFINGSSMQITAYAPSFSSSSVREVRVHAVKGTARSTASFALPLLPDALADSTARDIFLDGDNLTVLNADGSETDAVKTETDENGSLKGFVLNETDSSESVCLWSDKVFTYSGVFRMYYEVRTLYTDNDPLSTGSPFGGYGLAVFPSGYKADDLKCGVSGAFGLGYGGLNFGGAGFVLETDLYPNINFDYKNSPSANHLALMPCIFPAGTSEICMGSHLHEKMPPCPSESCSKPEPASLNWLEDEKSSSMRLELHSGYADETCSSKSADGIYVLAKAWADCTACSEMSADYKGKAPSAELCVKSADAVMNSIKIGFTFGGETGSKIAFDKIRFSAD